MSKRYAVLGLSVFLALALAVPALGGPANPVANISASAKSIANKALKKAKAAQQTANAANSAAAAANSAASAANSAASSALNEAKKAQTTANTANGTANSAKGIAEEAKTAAANAEANANNRLEGAFEQFGEATASNTETTKFTSVSCPTETDVLGGSYSMGGEAEKVTVTASEETFYGGGWFVSASAITGTPTWSITAIAMCGFK